MAFINYGDAAFTNHFVRNRGASETLHLHSRHAVHAHGFNANLRQGHVAWQYGGRNALRHQRSNSGRRKRPNQRHADCDCQWHNAAKIQM
eukprot:4361998-Pleurochrysis_carterae.AAC.1